jgi:hypothetical protein
MQIYADRVYSELDDGEKQKVLSALVALEDTGFCELMQAEAEQTALKTLRSSPIDQPNTYVIRLLRQTDEFVTLIKTTGR